jgi:hypothetical protein
MSDKPVAEQNIISRTASAVKSGVVVAADGTRTRYDYTAILSAIAFATPEIIDGLVKLSEYILSDTSGIHVPDNWKTPIRTTAFILAWIARSGLVRKPPAQDATPESPSAEPPK